MLRLLRANGDFESILSAVKGGMAGMARPSDHNTARVLRPTSSTLEFELMVSNPTAYPALRQSPLTALERQSLVEARRLHRSKSLDDQYVCPAGANPQFSLPRFVPTHRADCKMSS